MTRRFVTSARSRWSWGARPSPPKAETSRWWSRSRSWSITRGASTGSEALPPNPEQPDSRAAAMRPPRIRILVVWRVSLMLVLGALALAFDALDHLRHDNGQGRALPRLQNASGPDPPAFERLGAQAAACHQLPCPVRNDDREVLCPIA